jgi:hypothetical protein
MECKKWKRRKRNAQGSRAKRPPSLPFKDWREPKSKPQTSPKSQNNAKIQPNKMSQKKR